MDRTPPDCLQKRTEILQQTTPPERSHDSLPVTPLEVSNPAVRADNDAVLWDSIHTCSPPFMARNKAQSVPSAIITVEPAAWRHGGNAACRPPTTMKATLEFNLPIDSEAHRDAVQGSDWRWAVQDIMDYLRTNTKHVDHTAEEYRVYEAVREEIVRVLADRGLDLR